MNGEGTGDEYYDYNDLQAVALLTNENMADFDWTKPIVGSGGNNESLPTLKVATSDYIQSWDESTVEFSNQFRPRSPSEFIDNYSDGGNDYWNVMCTSFVAQKKKTDHWEWNLIGSYNSDQSLNDSDSEEDGDISDEPGCKIKEFGPKLVFKGDTAEAVEDPSGSILNINFWYRYFTWLKTTDFQIFASSVIFLILNFEIIFLVFFKKWFVDNLHRQ